MANILYKFVAAVFVKLVNKGIVCIVENPGNSLFWLTSLVRAMLASVDQQVIFHVRFHACMHGGQRKKETKFLSAHCDLRALAIQCDGSHQHAPWGLTLRSEGENLFATAEER
eukprot:5464742-Karenia_brevis.AAC.1